MLLAAAHSYRVRKQFLDLNTQRLRNTSDIIRPHQRMFLDVLPLLFHMNHPALPGFIGKDAPFGITAYHPSSESLDIATKTFNGFKPIKRTQWIFDIHALFLMGSCGTIAFSAKSDFDIWLCHRPDLPSEHINMLQKKATQIEIWGETLGLEVHFFLMNADRFREGKILDLSSESSGSTQFKLLLDEFYRTSIWVAGRIPLWWLIPANQEHNYYQIRDHYEANSALFADEYIDFGPIPDIPTTELFGAAIWHIYKGIESPYKSILKITAIEAYGNDYPNGIPLCQEFKQAVHDNTADAKALDPYLLLLRRLENYLNEMNEASRLEIIRRCFYIKLDVTSNVLSNPRNWRETMIQTLVEEWEWSEKQLSILDARKKWKIDRVVEERKLLVDHLTKSYLFLSNFARHHAKSLMIKQQDLTVLGRKLYSAFERKAGKIEIVNRGITNNAQEDIISIVRAIGKNNSEQWLLFQGQMTTHNTDNKRPIKHAHSLVELLTWAYFNQVYIASTRIVMHAPGCDLTIREINAIFERIQKLSPKAKLPYASSEALLNPSQICGTAVFLNVGHLSPLLQTTSDVTIASGQIDVLKEGNTEENFFVSLEHLYFTTWHEVFVLKYHNILGLIQWFCTYIHFPHYPEFSTPPPPPTFESFSSHLGKVQASRVMTLYQEIIDFFYCGEPQTNQQFIVEAVDHFYVLSRTAEQLEYQALPNFRQLLTFLEKPKTSYWNTQFESTSLAQSLIPNVLRENIKGCIQLFYHPHSDHSDFFILDEFGSLMYRQTKNEQATNLIDHYIVFFKILLDRQPVPPNLGFETTSERLKIYLINTRNTPTNIQTLQIDQLKLSKTYYPLRVLGNIVNHLTVFTIHCDDQAFNSQEYGEQLFIKVAQHILTQCKSQAHYATYITDLDLTPALTQTDQNSFIPALYYLRYKKRIEDRLNQTILALSQ